MRTGNLLIVVINLCILALSLKLYTEYFKDRVQANRKTRVKGGD